MANVSVYNIEGKEVGSIELNDAKQLSNVTVLVFGLSWLQVTMA